MCIKNLIPSIREARQAPMDTVGISGWIVLLLLRQQFALLDRVNRSMCIFTVLRQRSDVEETYRNFHRLRDVFNR